jgi:hypothetical protein
MERSPLIQATNMTHQLALSDRLGKIPFSIRRNFSSGPRWVGIDDWKLPRTPSWKVAEWASDEDLRDWPGIVSAVWGPGANWEALGLVMGRVDGRGRDLVQIDLDDCRNPVTGELSDGAAELVENLGTYTEVSQSFEGLHLFGWSDTRWIPQGIYRIPDLGRIEVWHTRRMAAITGRRLEGLGTSQEAEHIDQVLKDVLRRGRPAGGNLARLGGRQEHFEEGYRNDGLAAVGFSLLRKGADPDSLEDSLLEANELRCSPPLEEREVLSVARSVANTYRRRKAADDCIVTSGTDTRSEQVLRTPSGEVLRPSFQRPPEGSNVPEVTKGDEPPLEGQDVPEVTKGDKKEGVARKHVYGDGLRPKRKGTVKFCRNACHGITMHGFSANGVHVVCRHRCSDWRCRRCGPPMLAAWWDIFFRKVEKTGLWRQKLTQAEWKVLQPRMRQRSKREGWWQWFLVPDGVVILSATSLDPKGAAASAPVQYSGKDSEKVIFDALMTFRTRRKRYERLFGGTISYGPPEIVDDNEHEVAWVGLGPDPDTSAREMAKHGKPLELLYPDGPYDIFEQPKELYHWMATRSLAAISEIRETVEILSIKPRKRQVLNERICAAEELVEAALSARKASTG